MATEVKTKIRFPECRLSFVKIGTPGKNKTTGENEYEVTGLFEFEGSGEDWKKDPKFQEAIALAVHVAQQKHGTTTGIKFPFRLGDTYDRNKYPENQGKLVIPFRSKRVQPDVAHIQGGKAVKLHDLNELYSGCHGLVTATCYGYGGGDTGFARGVSFGLATLCKTRDDEHLGAHHVAENDFADLDCSAYSQDNSALFGNDDPGTLI